MSPAARKRHGYYDRRPRPSMQSLGGKARAKSLTARRRAQIARKAAQTRWENRPREVRAKFIADLNLPKPYDAEALRDYCSAQNRMQVLCGMEAVRALAARLGHAVLDLGPDEGVIHFDEAQVEAAARAGCLAYFEPTIANWDNWSPARHADWRRVVFAVVRSLSKQPGQLRISPDNCPSSHRRDRHSSRRSERRSSRTMRPVQRPVKRHR